jgi:hypothetical protein
MTTGRGVFEWSEGEKGYRRKMVVSLGHGTRIGTISLRFENPLPVANRIIIVERLNSLAAVLRPVK